MKFLNGRRAEIIWVCNSLVSDKIPRHIVSFKKYIYICKVDFLEIHLY